MNNSDIVLNVIGPNKFTKYSAKNFGSMCNASDSHAFNKSTNITSVYSGNYATIFADSPTKSTLIVRI